MAAVRPTAETYDGPRVAALELQALDKFRGIDPIQIEVEEREPEAPVGKRFERFIGRGREDGGVPSHAQKREQMGLHLRRTFDKQHALVVHVVPRHASEHRSLPDYRTPVRTPARRFPLFSSKFTSPLYSMRSGIA